MSLSELILNQVKPWLNARVQNLTIDGTITPSGIGTQIVQYMVGPMYTYKTIQSAIDAAFATSPSMENPAIVYIYPGTYTENLTCQGAVFLTGLINTDADDASLAGQIESLQITFPVYNAVVIKGHHNINTSTDPDDQISTVPLFSNITFLSDGSGNVMFSIPSESLGYQFNMIFTSCKIYCEDNDIVFKGEVNQQGIVMKNCYVQPSIDASTLGYSFLSISPNSSIIMDLSGTVVVAAAPINTTGLEVNLDFYADGCQLYMSFMGDGGVQSVFVNITNSKLCGSLSSGSFSTIFTNTGYNVNIDNCTDINNAFKIQLSQYIFFNAGGGNVNLSNCSYPGVSQNNIANGTFTNLTISNFLSNGPVVYSDNEILWIGNGGLIGNEDTTKLLQLNGVVTKPYQPCAQAYVTGNLSNVTGDGTIYGPILYNETAFDQTSSYDTSTGLFTCPQGGIYAVSCTITAYGNPSFSSQGQTNCYCWIQQNGSSSTQYGFGVINPAASANIGSPPVISMPTHQLILCEQGDTLGIYIRITGGTKTVNLPEVLGGTTVLGNTFNIMMVA